MAFEAEVKTYIEGRAIYASADRVRLWDNSPALETVARTPFAYIHGGDQRVRPRPTEFPQGAIIDPEVVALDDYFPRDGAATWAADLAAHLDALRTALTDPAALLGTDGVWVEVRERTPSYNDATLTFGWAITAYTITRHKS